MIDTINSTDLIHDDCKFVEFNIDYPTNPVKTVFGPDEIRNRKNFLKDKISDLLDGKTVGRTVLFHHNEFGWIVPGLKACWELGCNIFVHDFHPAVTKNPEFSNFYNFISLIINDRPSKEAQLRHNVPSVNFSEYCSSKIYPEIKYQLNDVLTPDTVAVKTHTSGTTGMPKIIDYSHRLVYHLNNNNKLLFEFNSDDRPWHWKTLHHSSLFLNYAIPLLNSCKTHYFPKVPNRRVEVQEYAEVFLPLIAKEKITRTLLPYDWIQFFSQYASTNLNKTTSLHVIRGLDQNAAHWAIKNLNPREIIDTFGCSEIGVMFIERINSENIDQWQPGSFSISAPGLQYQFNDTCVEAGWEGYPKYVIEDIMKKEQDRVRYLGRNYSIRVNEEIVLIYELEKYLRKMFDTTQFQLVVDFKNNKLYLAIFDRKIPSDLFLINQEITKNFSSAYKLEKVKYYDITSMQSGMKPNAPILLYSFLQESKDESAS